MAHIIEDLTVPVPPATAFAYVADFTNTRHWDPQIDEARQLDTGPVGVGSAFEVALRIGSRTTMLVYTVTVFAPDEHVVLETYGTWYRGRDDVRIRPSANGGSEVRWDATFALRGPFIVFEPLLRIGFRRTAQKAVAGLGAALTALHSEEGRGWTHAGS
jgi:hypothetical protein